MIIRRHLREREICEKIQKLSKLENIPIYVSKHSWELEKIRKVIGDDTLLISLIRKLPENAYIYHENTILIIDVLKKNCFPINLLSELSERAFSKVYKNYK